MKKLLILAALVSSPVFADDLVDMWKESQMRQAQGAMERQQTEALLAIENNTRVR